MNENKPDQNELGMSGGCCDCTIETGCKGINPDCKPIQFYPAEQVIQEIDDLIKKIGKKKGPFYYIKRRIRFYFQTVVRGFSDKKTWSLDYEIANYISLRLHRFKEVVTNHPTDITMMEWYEEIDEMIWFFEDHMNKIENNDYDASGVMKRRRDKAKRLFMKRFDHLWW